MRAALGNGGKEIFLDSKPYGGDGRFKAYLLEGKDKPVTAVILLHGRHSNPGDGPVVGQLRRSLQEAGYTTLSLANPVPEKDEFPNYVADIQGKNALFPEAYARLRAGMAALARLRVADVVLLGFSMGARMHAAFLAEGNAGSLPVRGFVALSNGTNGVGPLNGANSLSKVLVPVLDVYGEGDPLSAETAAARKAAYESGRGKSFIQVRVGNNAPHAFDGSEAEMEAAVPRLAEENRAARVLTISLSLHVLDAPELPSRPADTAAKKLLPYANEWCILQPAINSAKPK